MNQYKTVLAPNAPWPKWETVEKPKKQQIANKISGSDLAYFLQNEASNHYKTSIKHRTRDKLSGRFTSNSRVEK